VIAPAGGAEISGEAFHAEFRALQQRARAKGRPGQRQDQDQTGEDAAATATALLAGIRDGAWLDAQTFPPLRYAVPDLLPEGFALLVGPPKIGKSWFVINTLLGRAAGGYALGTIPVTEPRRVLYLALEDSDRRMQDRCRALLGTDEPIPPLFHYLTVVEPGQLLATIDAFMTRHPQTALVVVDTLGKIMPAALPGESAYQRDYRVGSALQQVARDHPGLAVVVCHHDRKATSSDFIDSVSGTHGLAGAADSVLVLTRDRSERAGLLQLTGRDIPEGEYALILDDGRHWRLDGSDLATAAARARDLRATAGLGDRSAEVISFVGKHPQGATPAEVAAALGMDPRAAATYLGRAEAAGRICKPRRGLYTPVVTVVSVVAEGADGEDDAEVNTYNGYNRGPGERGRKDKGKGKRRLAPAPPALAERAVATRDPARDADAAAAASDGDANTTKTTTHPDVLPSSPSLSPSGDGHGAVSGFEWSMQAEPVGPCAVCTQACYSHGPDGRPTHPGCWRRGTPPGIASPDDPTARTGTANDPTVRMGDRRSPAPDSRHPHHPHPRRSTTKEPQ